MSHLRHRFIKTVTTVHLYENIFCIGILKEKYSGKDELIDETLESWEDQGPAKSFWETVKALSTGLVVDSQGPDTPIEVKRWVHSRKCQVARYLACLPKFCDKVQVIGRTTMLTHLDPIP